MQKIIYFGNDLYAENKTSSHHIAERLAHDNKLLYIECPGLRAPKSTGRDMKKIFSKIWKSLRGPIKISKNFYGYTLLQLPFHKYSFVRAINQWLVLLTVNILKIIFRFSKPILWFVVPHLSMVPSRISNICSVYYCIDDYAGIPDVDTEAVEAMDNKMTRDCDIVFIASETLLEKKKQLNKNVYFSPHGVDFEHFNNANNIPTRLIPKKIKEISPPIIGYFGLIDDRIDLELIKYIALKRPEWNFVFIGRIDFPENPCHNMINVHFLGKKTYNDLPLYGARFSIGIMPYKPNHRMNINCNPLKLREYLSIGIPIVSAQLPQVELFNDVVSIANTPEEYISSIEKLLMEKDLIKYKKLRQDRVKGATWDARFSKVFSIVQQYIEAKN